ncbi:hypothetical protein WJX82_010136 [Trebouxia sp. C0006]
MEVGRQAAKPLSPDILVMLSRQLESRNSAKHCDLEKCEEVNRVYDVSAPGPNGHIPIRVYDSRSKVAAAPLLIYLHGGCWFLNSNFVSYDAFCRRLGKQTGCVVMAIDYRLSSEWKFPAGLEDCYAATQYCADQATFLNCSHDQIAIVGDSCGANLATAVCLLIKERGGQQLCAQVLLYPLTDYYLPAKPSFLTYDSGIYGVGFSGSCCKLGWDLLGADREPYGKPQQPSSLAAVLQHADVSGLPPAYIVLAECDIVHDEGEMYAQKLLDAGNTVHVKDYKGACHGHMMMAVDASIGGLKCQHGLEAIDDLCKMLAHLFKAS